MIRPRTYFLLFLLLLILLLCGTAAFNYKIDLYGIFRNDRDPQLSIPNQRFSKVRYLCRHPERFDSFVFGSSRVNSIDVRKIPGGRWYNMTYDEGVPHEHLQNLVYLIKRGVKVRNVIVGLDEFSYTVNPEIHLRQPSRVMYPPVVGQDLLRFYLGYLLRMPDPKTVKEQLKIRRNNAEHGIGRFDLYYTGQTISDDLDRAIEADPKRHEADKKFLEPAHWLGCGNFDATLDDLREMVALAKREGIKLTIFINPLHQLTYRNIDHQKFFAFQKRLAEITDYYDFSGLNHFTRNNYYFYETSHYRTIVGNAVIKRITAPAAPVGDGQFGTLVTRVNVDRHLQLARAELGPAPVALK